MRTKLKVPLMWPITVSHKIDASSPLHKMSLDQLTDGTVEVAET